MPAAAQIGLVGEIEKAGDQQQLHTKACPGLGLNINEKKNSRGKIIARPRAIVTVYSKLGVHAVTNM